MIVSPGKSLSTSENAALSQGGARGVPPTSMCRGGRGSPGSAACRTSVLSIMETRGKLLAGGESWVCGPAAPPKQGVEGTHHAQPMDRGSRSGDPSPRVLAVPKAVQPPRSWQAGRRGLHPLPAPACTMRGGPAEPPAQLCLPPHAAPIAPQALSSGCSSDFLAPSRHVPPLLFISSPCLLAWLLF